MNSIKMIFSHDYKNDTEIFYSVNADMNTSHLEAVFTSEDPDFGEESLEFNASPIESFRDMVHEWHIEISEYLDDTCDGLKRPGHADEKLHFVYGDYSNSTLYAVENALLIIDGEAKPDREGAAKEILNNDGNAIRFD